jgi:hypothetical protein
LARFEVKLAVTVEKWHTRPTAFWVHLDKALGRTGALEAKVVCVTVLADRIRNARTA